MRPFAPLFIALIAIGLGCTGAVDTPEQNTSNGHTDSHGPDVTAATTKETAAMPTGWSVYSNPEHGFEVAGPGTPAEQSLDNAAQKMNGRMYQFGFANNGGQGQVLVMTYVGPEAYDLEKGLDGACNGAIQNIKGNMLNYETVEIDGRPGREFSFEVNNQGFTFAGRGKAIGVAPKTIHAAMTFYPKDVTNSATLSDAFVDSFRVTKAE